MIRTRTCLLLLTTILAACSGQDDTTETQTDAPPGKVSTLDTHEPPDNPEDSPGGVGDGVRKEGNPAVAPADLEPLLPAELLGLKRILHDTGETGSARVSQARAEYGGDDVRLSLMITDLGGVSGLARMGMELFATELDHEDERGFERTATYRGHRSFQRMQRSGDQSIAEMMVFVDDRFTVQLDAQNLPWKKVINAMDEVNLDMLSAMKAKTVRN